MASNRSATLESGAWCVVALVALVAFTGRASAQGTISTDRPGNGNAATTVPQGVVQLEWGGNAALDGGAGSTAQTYSFPTGLRLGFLPWIELRLNSELVAVHHSGAAGDGVQVGATDLALGVKLQLVRQLGLKPNLALIAQLTTPVGDARISAGQALPWFSVLASWSWPHGFGTLLTANIDLPPQSDGDGVYARFGYLAQLAYTLPLLGERLSLFVEAYGLLSAVSREASWHQLDGGVLVLITPNLQLDINAQIGLTADAPDVQLGLGLAYRFAAFTTTSSSPR